MKTTQSHPEILTVDTKQQAIDLSKEANKKIPLHGRRWTWVKNKFKFSVMGIDQNGDAIYLGR